MMNKKAGAPPGNKNRLSGETKKDAYLHIRIEPALKSALVAHASQRGLKLADWVTSACNQKLERENRQV